MDLLREYGPDGPAEQVGAADALSYVRGLAAGHYENFSVLSRLVPHNLRDDFASVYAFCRWADDLGDETGSDQAARDRSRRLLGWWRSELRLCFSGEASHPVFVALWATIQRHGLSITPFEHLIDAFVQDQEVRHYQTWDQLLGYCSRSADPVGRIVLHLAGYPDLPENAERYAMSDATCTALQLTNFWQDVRRDLLERDRVYMPSDETGVSVESLRGWAMRPQDPAARVSFIHALRPLVERTRPLFERGRPLPASLTAEIRPVVWLFGAGGRAVLSAVERIGCTTLWTRPRLTPRKKALLVGRAWLASRLVHGTNGK